MDALKEIELSLKKVEDKYRNAAADIIRDFNIENTTRDDYKTRQIYELMQNADDCFDDPKKSDIQVLFELRDNLLIVQNTGKPFDTRGVKSLLYSNFSSKHDDKIGCKGLGFRSVLNWADEIDIYTKEFNLFFSKEHAIKELEKYKSLHTLEDKDDLNDIEHVAILTCPIHNNDLDKKKQFLTDRYATSIVLHCKNEFISEIESQLENLKFEELLFLKHICKVLIKTNKIERVIDTTKEEHDTYDIVCIQENGKQDILWKTWTTGGSIKQEDGKDKKYEITIAYPFDDRQLKERLRSSGVIYSYFKTDVPVHLPFLIHATLELNSNRNTLVKTSTNNKIIFDEAIKLIVKIGKELADPKNESNYDALDFLLSKDNILFFNDNFSYSQQLKSRIKEMEVFPTINGKYISLSDVPHYFDSKLPTILNKDSFSNLLKNTDNSIIKKFLIEECSVEPYDPSEFCDLVNKDANYYVEKGLNAEILYLFYQQYNFQSCSPKLIIDKNGSLITDNSFKVFSTIDTAVVDLPSWSSMRFVSVELENELINLFGSEEKYKNSMNAIGISTFDKFNIAKELNTQCNDDPERVKEYLKWLFDNFVDNYSSIREINPKIVTRNKKVLSCSDVYLGNEYNNALGERLLSHSKDSNYEPEFLLSKEELGLKDIKAEDVREFFICLGIKLFPSFENIVLKTTIEDEEVLSERDKYLEYCESFFNDYKTKGTIRALKKESEKSISVIGIRNLPNILKNAFFEDIICWVFFDKKMKDYLSQYSYELNDVWTKLCFKYEKWIKPQSGEPCNSTNCLLKDTDFGLSPALETVAYSFNAFDLKRKSRSEIADVFRSIGVVDNITSLDKEKIYEILLTIPTLSPSKKDESKRFYSDLNGFSSEDAKDLVKNNTKYNEFIQHGKVLANTKTGLYFLPQKDVVYVENKSYGDATLNEYNRIAMPTRAGKDKIELMFGVKPIEKEVKCSIASKELHQCNDEFQKYFKSILPYIYLPRYKNDRSHSDLSVLKNSTITLVSNAIAEYTKGEDVISRKLGEFDLVIFGYNAFINVPVTYKTLDDIRDEQRFKNAIADVLCTFFDVWSGRFDFISILGCKTMIEIENMIDSPDTINDIKALFEKEINYKEEFYRSLAKCLDKTEYQAKMACVDYNENFESEFNFKNFDPVQVINLFKHLNIDIIAYNETSPFILIHLANYYTVEFTKIKNQHKDKYLAFKLKEYIDNENWNKEEFEDLRDRYLTDVVEFKDSVYVDLVSSFEEIFGVSLSTLGDITDDPAELLELLLQMYPEEEKPADDSANDEEDKIDLKEVNKQIEEETSLDETLTTDISFSDPEESPSDVSDKGRRKGHKVDKKTNDVKHTNGFVAESKVHAHLVKVLGDKNKVHWISGNAEEAGEVTKGDDSRGFDMYYEAEDGIHFVEVKGRQGNVICFELTAKEREFGLANPDKFELWFVFILEKGKADKPINLGNIFSFNDNETFDQNEMYCAKSNSFFLIFKKDYVDKCKK